MKLLIHESPVGPLSLVSDGQALVALAFERHSKPLRVLAEAQPGRDELLDETCRQLDEYFAGQRRVFELPLAPRGTDFQRRVWMALREIPFGMTKSYGHLAEDLGNPKAVRAVGGANGSNPISIIVPCHRVIGANGELTGFGGGLQRKRFLLALESGQSTLAA
jgi:methylated-DNA-[protein]-cysteine S-methyltransferase